MPYLTQSLAVNVTLVLLLLFSIITWTLILSKFWQGFSNRRLNQRFKQQFWAAQNLYEGEQVAKQHTGYMARLAQSGFSALAHMQDITLSLDSFGDRKDILERTLRSQLQKAQQRMEYGLMALASIGSTAPFVGLFGTVWGIMHALKEISLSNSASLDIVAGPVGEALVATALGIATAIPAVLAYNYGVRRVRVTVTELDEFGTDFLHLVMKAPYRVDAAPAGDK